MTLSPLVDALRAGPHPGRTAPLPEVAEVLRVLVAHLALPTDREVPYGRYLVHEQPAFNLQLDVFSHSYRGGLHRHGTWGMFAVLRGALEAEDYAPDGTLLRVSHIGVGSGMSFAEDSDWHRVSTGAGPQTVSLHLYGPGFDLDVGEAMDPGGPVRTYRRSPFGAPSVIEALFGA